MSKLKAKQIFSDGVTGDYVISTDGNGNTVWTEMTGEKSTLGTPTDGSLTDPRYTGGKPPAAVLNTGDKVVDAIDTINEILGLLLPDAPAAFGGSTLSLATASTSALFAQGATVNGGSATAGATVTRITSSTMDSLSIGDKGDGVNGTITLWRNGSAVAGESLTFTDSTTDVKATGALRISDNKWTSPPGFYQTFDASVSGLSVPVGNNTVQIKHSVSGDTNVLSFVRDDMLTSPGIANVQVVEGTLTAAYSSGIPHYASGSTLTVSADISNLAGQTYKSGNLVTIAGPGSDVTIAPGQAGLPAILSVNHPTYGMSSQTFTIGGNRHTTAQISVSANNLNGAGSSTNSKLILVKSGTGQIDENNITTNLGVTVFRFGLQTGGDYPALNPAGWNSNNIKANYEASVVGGVLKQDKTNYTTGYLPVGPDYSGKDDTQYATFRFVKAGLSTFRLVITGTYTDLLIGLPGISNDVAQSPNALGGSWWTAKALYNGSGVPGRAGDTSAGCASATVAAGSGTQTVVIDLGSANTTYSTGNTVLVRFKLTSGQAITSLAINS